MLMVSIFILIIGLLDLFNPIRSLYQKYTSPIQFGLRHSAFELKEAVRFFSNVNLMREENLSLRRNSQELTSIIVDLKKAAEENDILRKQLELSNDRTQDRVLVMALTMGNPRDPTGTSMILDKGGRHGVKVGNIVILGNFLVGRITETTRERSKVLLITSPQISMTVSNLNTESSAEGLAQGDKGTRVKVTKILPGERVDVGDIFVTTGKDGNYLPGFAIGRVDAVSFESAEPLKSATLIPMTEYDKLEKVFIIIDR